MKIYGVHLSFKNAEEIIEKYRDQLTPSKRERIGRLRKEEDQLRLLAGEFLVQYALHQEFGIIPKQMEITYNAYGKPYILGQKHCYFNISHSHEWVVCITDKSEVGIDIEKIEEVELDIAKEICTKQEYETLCLQTRSNQNTYFYDLWTIKESYTKALGQGLSIPLEEIRINEEMNEVSIVHDREHTKRYYKRYEKIVEYKLVVCTKQFIEKLEMVMVNIFS